nr:MAG TPA: hypothetical protein [Bacteriophage sp.]
MFMVMYYLLILIIGIYILRKEIMEKMGLALELYSMTMMRGHLALPVLLTMCQVAGQHRLLLLVKGDRLFGIAMELKMLENLCELGIHQLFILG